MTINGTLFEQMIKCSLQNLRCFEEEINSINVFPVSDGDTGTNMRFTLENGINSAPSLSSLGSYLKNLSKGMLFGARGNSGVILSQLFKGFYNSLSEKEEATILEFSTALTAGAELAYKSVVNPVEGTILTVTRDGIESTKGKINSETDLLSFFTLYLAELQKVLQKTPEYLPQLKANGVVDSGGVGYYKIIEGMKKFLTKENINASDSNIQTRISQPDAIFSSESFTKDSEFVLGYCLEFVLQIMDSKCNPSQIQLQRIIKDLKKMGESLVAVQDETVIKIHIHVKNPVPVISYMLQFGEFISFKLENMQLQHNEHFSKTKKDLCIIAVANNPTIKKLFLDLGCDLIIDDETLQNTTCSDFINAINLFDAKHYLLLPNCKNLIPGANQAKSILEKNNITIIPTSDIAQGYYTLAMDDNGSNNMDFRLKQMKEGFDFIETLLVTSAVKSSVINGLAITNGDKVFIHDGEIIHNSVNLCYGLVDAINKIDMTDRSTFAVFSSDKIGEQTLENITELLNTNFPEMQLSFFDNPNSIYDIILGVF